MTCPTASTSLRGPEGEQFYAKYLQDAEQECDSELVGFFWQVQHQDARRASGQVSARQMVGAASTVTARPGRYVPTPSSCAEGPGG